MGDLAVAAGVNPVGTGMDAWSKMLGIQQQRQQLQTGAYQQQSAQAQAQQQQIQAQEMQAVRSIFSNPPTKADGTIDQDAVTQAVARSAPNFGLPRVGELIDTAQKGLNFKKSTLGLTSDLQNETRQIMGAWAADPKPNVSDLASNLDTWARQRQQTYPGVADYKNDALALISKLPTEQRRQMALLYSQGGMPMQQTVGPGGVAIGSNGTIDTGKQVKVGTFAPPQQGGGPGSEPRKGELGVGAPHAAAAAARRCPDARAGAGTRRAAGSSSGSCGTCACCATRPPRRRSCRCPPPLRARGPRRRFPTARVRLATPWCAYPAVCVCGGRARWRVR